MEEEAECRAFPVAVEDDDTAAAADVDAIVDIING